MEFAESAGVTRPVDFGSPPATVSASPELAVSAAQGSLSAAPQSISKASSVASAPLAHIEGRLASMPERTPGGPSGTDPARALERALQEVGRLADSLLAEGGASSANREPVGEPDAAYYRDAPTNRVPSRGRREDARRSDDLDVRGSPPGLERASVSGSGNGFAPPIPANFPDGISRGDQLSATAAEPDADRLASLINDVLAEQARRHGVDLS